MADQKDSIALLDTDLLFRLKYFSEKFNIPYRLVVQNLLIKEWARCAAIVEVEGVSPSRIMPEFQWDVSDGSKTLVTGEELFNRLVALYKHELVTLKDNMTELERRYETVLAKLLKTPEGRAEHEQSVKNALREYEKRKQSKP